MRRRFFSLNFPTKGTLAKVLALAIMLVFGVNPFGATAGKSLPDGMSRILTTAQIIDTGPTRFLPGDWDGRAVQKPAVLQVGSDYWMWYEGIDYWDVSRVGLAASPDGTAWVKYLDNPVMDRGPQAWEISGEVGPFVTFHDGLYKMWYEGSDGTVRQLGYATSPDGVNWTKYAGNPVLAAGPEGYDQDAAGHGAILVEGSTYKLWYHAIGDQGAVIAYATSEDGINWTKAGPVLSPELGTWEQYGLWGPSVLWDGDEYWMWYAGGAYYDPSIGVATSPDGITWTKYAGNPVIALAGSEIGDPIVIQEVDEFKMWFNNFSDSVIYYTESDDGIDWDTPTAVLYPGLMHPLEGFHDGTEGEVRSTGCSAFGWVVDPDDPNRDVTVQVWVDGEILVEEVTADLYREGIDADLCPEGTCGYVVDLWGKISAGVEHTIAVQAYDEESEDWWGLEATPKTLTCWGYPEGHHDGDDGDKGYPACSAFGWVIDPDDPNRDVTVQVMVDGLWLEDLTADQYREDIDPIICPQGTCGFSTELGDKISLNQPHEITVQAYDVESDSWLDLYSTPKTLTCQGGKLHMPLLVRQKREGERLIVVESGSQTFPANTPFHVAHGWRHDFPLENVELFDFELEVNGVYQLVDFVESTIDQSSDPHTLTKHSVFNFPEGMTGTHTFNGHWIAPCYVFFDDCDDPLELWEEVSEVLVTFVP
jgi:hypothetical protein